MKKSGFLCLLLLSILAFGITANAAYTDIESGADFEEAVYRLSDLGVINGYADGSFKPYDTVTRGQFAKMIVCAMDKEEEAKDEGYASKFPDVKDGYWAVPYINYVASSGAIKGYADGTFGAEKNITYAEGVTILLRILGYNNESLSANWAKNYCAKADNLGWNQGYQLTKDTILSRAVCAMILDDALFTDVSGEEDKCFLDLYDREVLKDVVVLASPLENAKLNYNEVSVITEGQNSDGKVYISDMTLKRYGSGTKYSHVVLDDKTEHIIAAKPDSIAKKAELSATITKIAEDRIEYVGANGVKGTVYLESSFVTYIDNSKSTYQAAKGYLTTGTDMTLYGDEYGDWDFLAVSTSTSSEPVLASRNYNLSDNELEGITINHKNLTVYRDGKAATLEDIKANDVVYYNQKTNIMDVYNKKVTGIYYEAQPSKAYVTSVTVGGKTYEIGTVSATSKLDASSGAFEIGDKVTLLLGKNDEVVFVLGKGNTTIMDYGVLESAGTRIKESGNDAGKAEYIADVFMPDGVTYTYVTDKNYKDYVGSLVKLGEKNNMISLSKVTTSSISGEVDKSSRTIGGKKFSDDGVIIQKTEDKNGKFIVAQILNFDTLNVSKITGSNVINVINSNDGISILYVKNLTDSGYDYGILKKKTENNVGDAISVTYSIYSDAKTTEYRAAFNTTSSYNAPVAFKVLGGELQEIKLLTKYASAGSYTYLDETSVTMVGETFDIATNVRVFKKKDNDFTEVSFTDLKNADIKDITVYSNVSKSSDGEIKLITFTE